MILLIIFIILHFILIIILHFIVEIILSSHIFFLFLHLVLVLEILNNLNLYGLFFISSTYCSLEYIFFPVRALFHNVVYNLRRYIEIANKRLAQVSIFLIFIIILRLTTRGILILWFILFFNLSNLSEISLRII